MGVKEYESQKLTIVPCKCFNCLERTWFYGRTNRSLLIYGVPGLGVESLKAKQWQVFKFNLNLYFLCPMCRGVWKSLCESGQISNWRFIVSRHMIHAAALDWRDRVTFP